MEWSSIVSSVVGVPLHILPPIMDTRYGISILSVVILLQGHPNMRHYSSCLSVHHSLVYFIPITVMPIRIADTSESFVDYMYYFDVTSVML